MYPSAGARATSRAAIMLLAPGRLSTMTGWPSASPSFGATRRAVTSTALPGPVGTIQRTGFAGYGCAAATALHDSSAASVSLVSLIGAPSGNRPGRG